MRRDDYDMLAGVLAGEHRVARDAQQLEQVALAIAAAIARDNRRFDPVEFVLAACEAATIEQLSAPVRGQIAGIFGTSEPKQRPGPAPELRPDELIDTTWWADGTPVGSAIWAVSRARAAAVAATALYHHGVRTVGQLASMTNEDLRRVPRLGTGGMRVIRKVLNLWHAKQQAAALRRGHDGLDVEDLHRRPTLVPAPRRLADRTGGG